MSNSTLDRAGISKLERLKIRLGTGVCTTAEQIIERLTGFNLRGRKGTKWCEYVVGRAGCRVRGKGWKTRKPEW